ncbi:hypothetical protein ACFL47_05530 [Candidatus Latescibacterota bacterium]
MLSKKSNGSPIPWQALYQSHLVWEDGYAPVAEGGYDKIETFTSQVSREYPLDGCNFVTHVKSDFYWDINHAQLHFERIGARKLRIHFVTMTPNFDSFYFRIGNEVRKATNSIVIDDVVGDFSLQSINKFGIKGPRSQVSLVI